MSNTDIIAQYTMQINLLSDDLGGGYEAFYIQLSRGVVGHGATPQESITDLLDMVPDFIEAIEEMGQKLEPPVSAQGSYEPKGKIDRRTATKEQAVTR